MSMWLALHGDKEKAETHENQGSIKILVALLHIFSFIPHHLSFAHGVEIELGVIDLGGLLNAASGQFVGAGTDSAHP